MCVILYKKEKSTLDLETLKLIVKKNPDGLGYAINKGNYWSVKKCLSPNDKDLKSIVKQCENNEAVIHARIATSGGVTLENCQPIYDTKMILFHNGVVSSLNGISKTQSDTALLFEMLKSSKIDREVILKNLAEKSGSKFVLIDQNDVLLIGAWSDYKGLKASNLYFVPPKITPTATYWGSWGYNDFDPVQYIPLKTYEVLKELFHFKKKDFETLAFDVLDEIDWESVYCADALNSWLQNNGYNLDNKKLTDDLLDPRK